MHQKFSNKFKFKKKTHNQFQDKVILKIVERSNLMIIISMKKINSTLEGKIDQYNKKLETKIDQ